MADEQNDSIPEPPYKKNLERLAALQERLSKVQKTAESLLATVSGTGSSCTAARENERARAPLSTHLRLMRRVNAVNREVHQHKTMAHDDAARVTVRGQALSHG